MPTNKNQEPKMIKPINKISKVTKKSTVKKVRSKKTVKKILTTAPVIAPTITDTPESIATDTSQINSNLIRDLKNWKILAWFGITTLVVLLVISIIAILTGPEINNKANYVVVDNRPAKKIEDSTIKQLPAPLTGLPMDIKFLQRRPWAVVVENFPTVRPQFGLSQADIIFESPTEGGITRFLAIYQSQMPDKVGPIRSARSFFNDWARPYSPYYSHSGGSTLALKQLSQGYGNIFDVNEFYNGAAYARDNSKDAPHNLFTTAEKFLSYIKTKDTAEGSVVPAMSFVDQLVGSTTAEKVTVPYKPEEYEVTFNYQTTDGYYERQVMGQTLTDANTNSPLRLSNVVVLFTDIIPIPNDSLKRVDLRTIGQGKVLVFSNGQQYTGTWQKNSPDSQITFMDENKQPIPFKPGQTWISVIDKSSLKSVTVK